MLYHHEYHNKLTLRQNMHNHFLPQQQPEIKQKESKITLEKKQKRFNNSANDK